jgi:hypothetical protein
MNPNDAAAIAAVAAAISALAALVSLGALVFSAWLQWTASRPRVDVIGQISTIVSARGMDPSTFGVEVRNVGIVPVVVTSVGVVFRDGELGTLPYARGPMGEQVLPKKLEPGEAASLTNELQPVVDAYHDKGITAVWARTAAGRTYRGKNTAKLGSFKRSTDSG